MPDIPSIDLHPEKIRGDGPETALLAARAFIEQALRAGWRDVRIITGLGIHGDGTPRLRSRVEREVLSAFFSQILSQHYEQGGAVIRLELKSGAATQNKRHLRQLEKQNEHRNYIEQEERVSVAYERFEAAELYLDEGDLRRAKLKLNQIAREFFPELGVFEANEDALRQGLSALKKKIDGLG